MHIISTNILGNNKALTYVQNEKMCLHILKSFGIIVQTKQGARDAIVQGV